MYRLLILLFCVLVSVSYADEIYKYVDKAGNVVYSGTPPENADDVESLQSAPEASADELKAARERQQKLQTYIDESASDRIRREAAKQHARSAATPAPKPLPSIPPVTGP